MNPYQRWKDAILEILMCFAAGFALAVTGLAVRLLVFSFWYS